MAHPRRAPRPDRLRDRRLDPKREVMLHHVTDGPAKGWLHTHGLAAHGKPELEIRGVPRFLGRAAAGLLNDLADYLLNDATAPLAAGELIAWGASTIRVVAGEPDEAAGYDPAHYESVRLVIEDPPDSGCECAECSDDLARRPRRLPN